MTRKDYIAIAQVIKSATLDLDELDQWDLGWEVARRQIARHLADDVLAIDNPRFDRSKFLQAAGVPQ